MHTVFLNFNFDIFGISQNLIVNNHLALVLVPFLLFNSFFNQIKIEFPKKIVKKNLNWFKNQKKEIIIHKTIYIIQYI